MVNPHYDGPAVGSSTESSFGAVGGYTPPPSSGGSSYYSGNNSSNNSSSNNNTTYYDPKADEDAGVYEENKDLYDYLSGRDPDNKIYQPPENVYGPGTATPGKTGYASININPKFANELLRGLSVDTLNFFGYDPKNPANIPVELLKMITEGSKVTDIEKMNTNEALTFTQDEYEQMSNPNHPNHNYYQFMERIARQKNLINIEAQEKSGGNQGYGYGYGYGYGRGRNFGYGPGGITNIRRYAHPGKNKSNFGSEIASAIANRTSSPPINQFLFTQMLRRMPGGGITELV